MTLDPCNTLEETSTLIYCSFKVKSGNLDTFSFPIVMLLIDDGYFSDNLNHNVYDKRCKFLLNRPCKIVMP